MKRLMLGNEAVARGLYEAGCRFVSSYPGTPSTEITEFVANYPEVYAEWAPNEKVAVESAIGASIAGARSFAAMKHVGANVAADPIFTVAYSGVSGGLVIAVADDPGMHSSQNEQDTRFYAMSAHVPILEPSTAQEAYDYIRLAFEMSEACDLPVILRMTTRIAHTRGIVAPREADHPELRPYEKRPDKYVMMPGFARPRKHAMMANLDKARAFAKERGINRVELGNKQGFLCAGGVYQYVKEAMPGASVYAISAARGGD